MSRHRDDPQAELAQELPAQQASRPQVSAALRGDVSLLAWIIRTSFRDVAQRFGLGPQNCPTHPSNCTAEWIERAMDKGARYWICDAEAACGCVAMEQPKPEVVYLERLAVLPEYRDRGLGQTLVRHVLDEARLAGAQRVELAMIAEHVELRRWYEKQGFVATRTTRFEHLPFEVLFMGRQT